MKISAGLERFIDVLGEILAFFTVALIVFMFVNRLSNDGAGFLPTNINNILVAVREIAVLAVLGLKGLEFALKRGILIFIIYGLLVAAAVILMFFPNVLPFASALVSAI